MLENDMRYSWGDSVQESYEQEYDRCHQQKCQGNQKTKWVRMVPIQSGSVKRFEKPLSGKWGALLEYLWWWSFEIFNLKEKMEDDHTIHLNWSAWRLYSHGIIQNESNWNMAWPGKIYLVFIRNYIFLQKELDPVNSTTYKVKYTPPLPQQWVKTL